jgi:hypothetical protein
MITPNDNKNDNTLNVIIFEGQNVIISSVEDIIIFQV